MGHSDSFLLGRVFMYGPLSWNQPSTLQYNFFFTHWLASREFKLQNSKTEKRRRKSLQ